MNVIYILDKNLVLQGVIDEYVSAIWRPSYSEIGDFEIYLGATKEAVALLQKNWYVVRSADVHVVDGVATYRKVMVIKNTQLVTDVENGDYLTVTGREMKFLLHQRIVWDQTTLTGTAEDAIRQLVTDNAVSPADPNRIIPRLVLGEPTGIPDNINKQVTGEYLDTVITEICTVFNYGWELYISDGQLVLELYAGIDRSYGQTENPYVVFSDDFENLYNTDYQQFTEDFANTTLIGGEGEGADRRFTTLGGNNSGLNRFEVFTDARDVSSNAGTENAISDSEYLLMLQERGREKLASLAVTEGFSGEVLSDVAFKYEVDFFLGDIVTVMNKYGLKKNVRVLSAIESEDEAGTRIVPQFSNTESKSGSLTLNSDGILVFTGFLSIDDDGILHATPSPNTTSDSVVTWKE